MRDTNIIIYIGECIDPKFTADDVDKAKRMLTTIINRIRIGGYVEGFRNDIAVDISICCYVLDVDPTDLTGEMKRLFELFLSDDEWDLDERLNVIDDYLKDWALLHNVDGHSIFDYCNLMDYWEKLYQPIDDILITKKMGIINS